jgi:hypothetical protein
MRNLGLSAMVVGAVAIALAFWLVFPAFKERRLRAFCDGVTFGEDAAALWQRGRAFDRARGKAAHVPLQPGDADVLEFSVRVPWLVVDAWHCNVWVDPIGRVSRKTLWGAD